MNGYNKNESKILKQDTIRLITQGEQYLKINYKNWDRKYQKLGLGMLVGEEKRKKSFGHDGTNIGYEIHFQCNPENNYIEIYMICHNNEDSYTKFLTGAETKRLIRKTKIILDL